MKKLKVTVVLLTVLVLVAVSFSPAMAAQPEGPEEEGALCETLASGLKSSVIGLVVGAFVAVLVEYWPAWRGFSPKWKRPIIGLFCLVVPLGSLGLGYMFCGTAIDENAVFLALAAGFAAFTSSQFAHIYKLPSK